MKHSLKKKKKSKTFMILLMIFFVFGVQRCISRLLRFKYYITMSMLNYSDGYQKLYNSLCVMLKLFSLCRKTIELMQCVLKVFCAC